MPGGLCPHGQIGVLVAVPWLKRASTWGVGAPLSTPVPLPASPSREGLAGRAVAAHSMAAGLEIWAARLRACRPAAFLIPAPQLLPIFPCTGPGVTVGESVDGARPPTAVPLPRLTPAPKHTHACTQPRARLPRPSP